MAWPHIAKQPDTLTALKRANVIFGKDTLLLYIPVWIVKISPLSTVYSGFRLKTENVLIVKQNMNLGSSYLEKWYVCVLSGTSFFIQKQKMVCWKRIKDLTAVGRQAQQDL